ncbi:hypothetical protein BGZ97_003463 [Linnemannia gamsii]|jgi:hypothetical protein|uniref:Transmembrane protein n=1 Tax=Linnemannia gamsii TaxID=64522 RepID=A0A9P6QV34_9FUNG|nr:hypothetical protein BGZ97_003463 [Linnemannia gamsii]
MKPLTLLQRQRITLSLFFTVAVGAVFTVAAPAFVPWKVVDNKRAQALDQQRRQGKDFHVIENRGRSRGGTDPSDEQDPSTTSTHHHNAATQSSISHQGPIISLLTDRKSTKDSESEGSMTLADTEQSGTTEPGTKKRRRRRKRKMVNEGWQEFTGRTAREEKEKEEKEKHHTQRQTSPEAEPLGENGGREISWKNKSQ